MKNYCVPLKNPKPDAKRFIGSLIGQIKLEKPQVIEYIVDPVIMRPILTDLIGREWIVPEPGNRTSENKYMDNLIEFWYRMGYDFIRIERSLPFQKSRLIAKDTASNSGSRAWVDQHKGIIMNWDDFEKYNWPEIEKADFSVYEYIDSHLPPGMGIMASHGGGIFEHLSEMMSYETLCIALYESPDLVEAMSKKIGSLMEKYYERLLNLKNIIAIFPGDDMGFRTGTLVSPEHLRKYVLPWHKRFAEMAHSRKIPYFLHSCGKLDEIMEDLIGYVKIDGKHSFENTITPMPEFQKRYGDRIAVLGGVDVDSLSSGTPGEVRKYVRSLIDACMKKGRFAIGSGNSIPSYIPVENYLTMLDETLK